MSDKVFFDIDQEIDLTQENAPKVYRQSLVDGDSAAHRWCVRVKRGKTNVPLDGYAVGCYIRRDIERDDGTQEPMMHVEGAVEDGRACAKFPPEVYQLGGPIVCVMRVTLTDGGIVALAVLRATSEKLLSDSLYDPEGVVPSLDELLAQIGDMKAATSDARLAAQEARDTMAGAEAALAGAQEAVAIAEGWAGTVATAESVPADQQPAVRMTAAEGSRRLHFEIPAGVSGVYIGSDEPTDLNVQVWLKPDGAIDEGGVVVDLAPMLAVKADAVRDESARADSHRLYAQKAPMQVTIHGTAEGVKSAWARTCGRNLFSAEWEYGTINNVSGMKEVNDAKTRTTVAIPLVVGKTYTLRRNSTIGNLASRYFSTPEIQADTYLGRGQYSSFIADGSDMRTFVAGGGVTAAGSVVYLALTYTTTTHEPEIDTLYTLVEGSTAMTTYEPYEVNRVDVALDTPLMEGETHTVELTALGAMPDNVTGSAQTSVSYMHDNKHYIDAQVAAAVALALS